MTNEWGDAPAETDMPACRQGVNTTVMLLEKF